MSRRWWLPGALIAFFLVAACGGNSGTPTAASSPKASPTPARAALITGPIDSCKLVTADEASAAAGATVTNMSSVAGAGATGICIYANSDTQAAVIVFAQAYPDTTSAQAVSADQIVAALNNGYGVSNAKSVDGIGDKAVEYSMSTSGPGGEAIFVFKSNVVMMIALAPSSDPSKVEALAKAAVGRLSG